MEVSDADLEHNPSGSRAFMAAGITEFQAISSILICALAD
jgi:hypothetical protein